MCDENCKTLLEDIKEYPSSIWRDIYLRIEKSNIVVMPDIPKSISRLNAIFSLDIGDIIIKYMWKEK